MVWAIRSRLIQLAGTKQTLRRHGLDLLHNFRQWRSLSTPAQLNALKHFFYLATLGSALLLAITGFLPVIIFGAAVSNVALMLHLLLAPLFAVGVAALSLFYAQRHRFNKEDWGRVSQWIRKARPGTTPAHPSTGQKICFWLGLLLAVPAMASTVLMMYPFYGTDGQEWLLHLHGYTGLLLLLVVMLHVCLVLAKKPISSIKRELSHEH
jgi:cytochrome b subunit of formate dehydrogenase